MASAHFNKVIIIQSLNDGKTGSRLFDDLNVLTVFTDGLVTVELKDVHFSTDFINFLEKIAADVRKGIYMPLLHIESHGAEDQSGLVLSSGEYISWEKMKKPLCEINDATQMNLIVAISACFGAGLTQALTITDRAPLWALVGPLEAMYPDDLLCDYGEFYNELLKSRDGDEAIRRLNRDRTGNEVLYYFTTAESFFEQVWIRYVNESCSDQTLNNRANSMIRQLRGKKRRSQIPSRNSIKQMYLDGLPEAFEKYSKRFFLLDIYPGIADRISFNYRDAVKAAEKASSSKFIST